MSKQLSKDCWLALKCVICEIKVDSGNDKDY